MIDHKQLLLFKKSKDKMHNMTEEKLHLEMIRIDTISVNGSKNI